MKIVIAFVSVFVITIQLFFVIDSKYNQSQDEIDASIFYDYAARHGIDLSKSPHHKNMDFLEYDIFGKDKNIRNDNFDLKFESFEEDFAVWKGKFSKNVAYLNGNVKVRGLDLDKGFDLGKSEDDLWLKNNIGCDLCKVIAGTVMEAVNNKWSKDEIVKASIALCKSQHIETDRICDLVVPQFKVSTYLSNTR